MSARFSVVVPVYNRAHILARPVASVLAQTVTDWELVIVDDGSTDDTQNAAKSFADPRIRVLHQDNAGASAARNTGLAAATGRTVVYLDSDDHMYPDCLAAIAATDARYGVCRHRRTTVLVDAAGKVILEKNDPDIRGQTVTLADFYDWKVKTTSSGLFHDRAAFAGVCWRDTLIEDLEFLLQLGAIDPEGFCYIDRELIDYRQVFGGDGLVSKATYGDLSKAFGQIYAWHKNDPMLRNPDVYLGRVEKYAKLQKAVEAGLEPPPRYKYFPEMWEQKA